MDILILFLTYLLIMMMQTSSEIRLVTFSLLCFVFFIIIALQTAHQLQLSACPQCPDWVPGEAPVPRSRALAPLCVGVTPGLENMQTEGRGE